MYNDYEKNNGTNGILMIVLIIVGVFVIGVISFFGKCISTYNTLVNMEEDVQLAEANVETMMQRRLELIPDLVSTVKAYSQHEEKVYEDIANARAALSSSLSEGDIDKISEANKSLTVAVNSLLAIAEDYPDLTSGEQYTSLMDQLEGSVNRIAVAREEYNDQVAKYNKKVRNFPGNIIAGMFGFEQIEEFKADEEASSTNMVNFNENE